MVQNKNLPRTLATRQTDTPPGHALARYIGTVLKKARIEQSLTITQVADRAELSRGMLSKIETGQVASSLESLSRLTEALGITLSQLFHDYDAPEGGAHVVRAGQGLEVVRRGTKRGHTYHMLAPNRGYKKNFEPFLISLDDKSEAFPTFQHEGTQFIHILEGRLDYRHGKQIYALAKGDSITFDAQVPHGPERLLDMPIRFLAITVFDDF